MFWIKTVDGYVRDDAIIDVHINKSIPGKVMFLLNSGDSICYKDFGENFDGARVAVEEFMEYICGGKANKDSFIKYV